MFVEEKQLRDFIADSGLVSKANLEEAEKEAARKKCGVGGLLVGAGAITDDDLCKIRAHILGIPFVDLTLRAVDFDVLSLIPEPISRRNSIIAFKREGDSVEVALRDVADLAAIDFIQKKARLKILPRMTSAESIKRALLHYQKCLKKEFGDRIRKEALALHTMPPSPSGAEVGVKELKKMAERAPAVLIVDALWKHALLQNASDIHVEPLEHHTLVRYRIDGMLHDAMTLPQGASDALTLRVKFLSNLKLDEKLIPQDGRFKALIGEGEEVSCRVSLMPSYCGERIVIRLSRGSASGFSLEGLGFHGEPLERIHRGLREKCGMMLVAGPSGSGKTTALYTMLDTLNTPGVSIGTVEERVEYRLPRANQVEVRPEIGLTFGSSARAILRQDPDIVMISDIKDADTAQTACNAVLTGRFVLGALSAESAPLALAKLFDTGVDRLSIASTLKAVVSGRVVRTLGAAKEKYFLDKRALTALAGSVNMSTVLAALKEERVVAQDTVWEKIPFYRAKPSAESGDGYSGHTGIHEVLRISPATKELILRGASAGEIGARARKEGMLTSAEDGVFKCVQGLTTIEEVFGVISR